MDTMTQSSSLWESFSDPTSLDSNILCTDWDVDGSILPEVPSLYDVGNTLKLDWVNPTSIREAHVLYRRLGPPMCIDTSLGGYVKWSNVLPFMNECNVKPIKKDNKVNCFPILGIRDIPSGGRHFYAYYYLPLQKEIYLKLNKLEAESIQYYVDLRMIHISGSCIEDIIWNITRVQYELFTKDSPDIVLLNMDYVRHHLFHQDVGRRDTYKYCIISRLFILDESVNLFNCSPLEKTHDPVRF